MFQVLRHVDVAVLQDGQQLDDAVVNQVLNARLHQIRFHVRFSGDPGNVIDSVDIRQDLAKKTMQSNEIICYSKGKVRM